MADHPGVRRGVLHPSGGRVHRGLDSEDLLPLAAGWGTDQLRAALADGDAAALEQLTASGDRLLLLAISDNGPQMRSFTTRLLAARAVAQQFGRPSAPTHQAWIETLLGHVKGEQPLLERIRDAGDLNSSSTLSEAATTVRLDASLGNVPRRRTHRPR